MRESDNIVRLRRAKEALEAYKDAEIYARKQLAMAEQATRKAKEKYEALFIEEENRQRAILMKNYRHCTS